MLEMLNLFNINDLVVEFKHFELKQKLDLEKAIQFYVKTLVEDIRSNQKLNIFSSIGPLKAICNISNGVYAVLSSPLESQNLYRGINAGFSSLILAVTEETQNFSKKVVSVGSKAINTLK